MKSEVHGILFQKVKDMGTP